MNTVFAPDVPLPHDEKLEASIIGKMLLNPEDAIDVTLGTLGDGEAFYNIFNRRAYKSITNRFETGKTVDALGVIDDLEQEYPDAAVMVLNAQGAAVSAADISERCDDLLTIERRRRAVQLGNKIVAMAGNRDTDPETFNTSIKQLVDLQQPTAPAFTSSRLTECGSWDIAQRDPVIEGVVNKGDVLIVSAPSKARKTWFLMNLAVHAATGREFLGMQCRRSKVLYVDFELSQDALKARFKAILDAKRIRPADVEDKIDFLCLRGLDFELRRPRSSRERQSFREGTPILGDFLEKACAGHDLVIFDPLYLMVDGDENSNSDMRYVARFFVTLAARINAVCSAAHHFAKGAAGGKASVDRGSGAGVFGRFPDAILTLNPLESEDEVDPPFRLEFVLRHHRPRPPVNYKFLYPLFAEDETLAELKVAGAPGRPSKITSKEINEVIYKLPKGKRRARDIAERLGVTTRTIYRHLKEFNITLNEEVEGES
jgi:AcrR family transcriptional regulator